MGYGDWKYLLMNILKNLKERRRYKVLHLVINKKIDDIEELI